MKYFLTLQILNCICSQYIIFPPHTTASSLDTDSRDSEGEEDGDTAAGSDSVTAPTEADGEIQVTKVEIIIKLSYHIR